jgi:hypothetical protein
MKKGAKAGTVFQPPPTIVSDHVPPNFGATSAVDVPASVSGASSGEILDHMKVQLLIRAYQASTSIDFKLTTYPILGLNGI